MTFVYFIRAKLARCQFNRLNFFSALYLAHSMEEDDESLKHVICNWSVGRTKVLKNWLLKNNHIKLWHAMDFRALVSKQTCEEVISCIPELRIWKRFRPESHAGASRNVANCPRCGYYEAAANDPLNGLVFEDDLYEEPPPKKAHLSGPQLLDQTWDEILKKTTEE